MEQPQTTAHSRRLPALLTAVSAIAGAQLRQARGLLLAIGATLLLAVTLTATIPPFSNVMLTAGLRSALTVAPDSDRLVVDTTPYAISTSVNRMLASVTDSAVGYYLRGYLSSQREALLKVPDCPC